MKHEDYQEMLAPHALGALDENDRALVQQHLATCAECRAELDNWHSTAGALAHVVDPLEPSARVRQRILDSVRLEATPAARNVVPLAPHTVSWFPRLAAMAASAILVGLTIAVVVLWQQNRVARTEVARLTAEAQQARKNSEQDQKLLELLSSASARVVQLTGTEQAPAASAVLAYDTKSGRAILRTNGLPQNMPGRGYQLWFIANGSPVPGHVFKVITNGGADSPDQIPAQALPTAVFAITEESESGASTPTGRILLKSTS